MSSFQCDECDYHAVIPLGDGGGPIVYEARVCSDCEELVQVPARFSRGEGVKGVALDQCPACGCELPGTEVSTEDLAWEDIAQLRSSRLRCPREGCPGMLEQTLDGFWTARTRR